MATTSPLPTIRRGISTAGAALLAIAGNILVMAIAVTGVALVVVAAAVVFGPGILEAF